MRKPIAKPEKGKNGGVAMITIIECVECGVDRDDLIQCLIESRETVNDLMEDMVYIGMKNKSYREPDGSDWGKLVRRLESPVTLRRVKGRLGVIGFYEQVSGVGWYTGNGNITLSPWDARAMLKSQ